MTTGEVACDSTMVLGVEIYDLKFGSGEDTNERGVGSGDDMHDLGLSSGCSSLLPVLKAVLFAVDAVRVCDFLDDHGSGIVMVKFCR